MGSLTNTKHICLHAGAAIALVAIMSLLFSCVPERKMTLEEAKQVTVATGARTFTPPPRTIDDILAILERTSHKEIKELKEAEIIVAASPPASASDKQLVEFYMKRMQALFKLGRFTDNMETGTKVARLLERVQADPLIYTRVARNAKMYGDIRQAISLFERAVLKSDSATGAYKELVELHLSIGDFETARKRKKRHLTLVTKSNAQRHGMVMWDSLFQELTTGYPDVTTDRMLVDATTTRMVLHPETLDVLVATNLHADILSDLAAALSGSLGMGATANLNPERTYPSMFEPIHGSAPKYKGKNVASPVGAIAAAAMMMDYLGEKSAAKKIEDAIARLLLTKKIPSLSADSDRKSVV